jgi:hypothetical protein
MREMLSKWPSRHVLAFVTITGTLGGATVGLTAVVLALVTQYQREAQRAELEAALKQDMIARGMSAAEIEQVVKATATPWDNPRRDDGFWRTQLVKDLKKQGLKAEEIERIVRAAYPPPVLTPTTPPITTASAGKSMPPATP